MRILEINICLLHYNTRREFILIIIVFLKKASVLRLDIHPRLAQPWKQDRDDSIPDKCAAVAAPII